MNLEGSRNLIEALRAFAPDARFIMASTGLVHNADSSRPSSEDDHCSPAQPFPASKLAAENELKASGLNWSVQRFGFVYGDGDGDDHIAAIPRLALLFRWHPANRLSLIHHRDIATSVLLALTGCMDGRTVNIVDEAPTTIFELAAIAGSPVEPSAVPAANPWLGHLDGSLARRLGFNPAVRTVLQAAQQGWL